MKSSLSWKQDLNMSQSFAPYRDNTTIVKVQKKPTAIRSRIVAESQPTISTAIHNKDQKSPRKRPTFNTTLTLDEQQR